MHIDIVFFDAMVDNMSLVTICILFNSSFAIPLVQSLCFIIHLSFSLLAS